jgi:hypothetical protein
MQKGDSALIVVSLYAQSMGGFFAEAANCVAILAEMIGVVAGSVLTLGIGSPALIAGATSAATYAGYAGTVAGLCQKGNEKIFVGSGNILIESDGNIIYSPGINGSDRGGHPPGPHGIGVKADRAEYYLKLNVLSQAPVVAPQPPVPIPYHSVRPPVR